MPGHAHRQGGSAGADFGTQLLGGRAKRLGKLSTLAQDAMLSTPDQLDRLSRRSDAARENHCSPRQNEVVEGLKKAKEHSVKRFHFLWQKCLYCLRAWPASAYYNIMSVEKTDGWRGDTKS